MLLNSGIKDSNTFRYSSFKRDITFKFNNYTAYGSRIFNGFNFDAKDT